MLPKHVTIFSKEYFLINSQITRFDWLTVRDQSVSTCGDQASNHRHCSIAVSFNSLLSMKWLA